MFTETSELLFGSASEFYGPEDCSCGIFNPPHNKDIKPENAIRSEWQAPSEAKTLPFGVSDDMTSDFKMSSFPLPQTPPRLIL